MSVRMTPTLLFILFRQYISASMYATFIFCLIFVGESLLVYRVPLLSTYKVCSSGSPTSSALKLQLQEFPAFCLGSTPWLEPSPHTRQYADLECGFH